MTSQSQELQDLLLRRARAARVREERERRHVALSRALAGLRPGIPGT